MRPLPRPTPAMAVACTALAVALGGTGYAAINLPRNSVGAAQLRAGAVTGTKVRDGSLTAREFGADALPRGLRGPAGPAGPTGSRGAPGDRAPAGAAAFASRDLAPAPGPVTIGTAFSDLIGLGVAAGTSGYSSSSGTITVTSPSRLVASGHATILNKQSGSADVYCRLVLVGSDVRTMGGAVNLQLLGGYTYAIAGVSGGIDADPRTYDVRLQCLSSVPAEFHRGTMTVIAFPR